jgi:HNH endonuclease
MNWKLIVKDAKKQPAKGTYSDWKKQISEECFYQCVYCSIHEAQFGGVNNYHIDHFRPKSIFAKLENDILNLFYACPICNRFKSDDWPAEPDLNIVSYPDPSKIDYSGLFNLKNDFEIEGKYIASQYLVLRLFLNRAQLIMERREEIKVRVATALMKDLSDLIDKVGEEDAKEAFEALKEIDRIKNSIQELSERRRKIRPYELKDIRKK